MSVLAAEFTVLDQGCVPSYIHSHFRLTIFYLIVKGQINRQIYKCLFSMFTIHKQCIHNLKIYKNRKWMVTREAHSAY